MNSFCRSRWCWTPHCCLSKKLQNTSVTLRWTGGLISWKSFQIHTAATKNHSMRWIRWADVQKWIWILSLSQRGMQEVGASYFSPGNLIQTTLLLSWLTRNVPLCGIIPAQPAARPPTPSCLIPQHYTGQKCCSNPRQGWGLLLHTAPGSDTVWIYKANTDTLLDEPRITNIPTLNVSHLSYTECISGHLLTFF